MDNYKDKKNNFSKDKRNKTDKLNELIDSSEGDFTFVPVENIHIINHIIDNLEEVKQRIEIIRSIR